MTSKQTKEVLIAKRFLNRLTRQIEREVIKRRIEGIAEGMSFLEKLELVFKI